MSQSQVKNNFYNKNHYYLIQINKDGSTNISRGWQNKNQFYVAMISFSDKVILDGPGYYFRPPTIKSYVICKYDNQERLIKKHKNT